MSGPDGVAGDRLHSFVERIERFDEDLKAMNDEKKDVFAEAKGEGFDVKILKEVIRPRKQDQNDRPRKVVAASGFDACHGCRIAEEGKPFRAQSRPVVYAAEVPQYDVLLELIADVNDGTLRRDPDLKASL